VSEEHPSTVFGFDKKKSRVHLISFRLNDEQWTRLNALFDLLEVQPKKDRLTDKMLLFIDRVEALKHEKDALIESAEALKKEKADVESKLETAEKALKKAESAPKKPISAEAGDVIKETRHGIFKDTTDVFKETGIVKEHGERLPYNWEKQQGSYDPNETMLRASHYHQKASEIKKAKYCLRGLKFTDPDTAEAACSYCFEKERHYYDLCHATVKFPVPHSAQKKLFP
jgi:hypothetical protein